MTIQNKQHYGPAERCIRNLTPYATRRLPTVTFLIQMIWYRSSMRCCAATERNIKA